MAITLQYTARPGIPALLPRVAARMAAARIFFGELVALGMIVGSDSTTTGVDSVTRTIVLTVLPVGERNFPTPADKRAATVGLYAQSLSLLIPASVSSAQPVVT